MGGRKSLIVNEALSFGDGTSGPFLTGQYILFIWRDLKNALPTLGRPGFC